MSLPFAAIEDKYEVLHKLGEGGMGEVYKVRHRLLGEHRVIKVIRPQHAERPSLRERFRREAQAAIRLRHPNIAQVFDFSIDEQGGAYTVMELIDGVTLKQLLARSGPPTLGLTMEIAAQSLSALGYLHQQGYLHRDIAPDNLMLCRNFDGRPLVKLIDLGLAKRLVGDLDLTSSGMFMGKVRYTSPEQFSLSKKDPDTRSDLYSFGVVLYELLTGECPIAGSALEEVVASHLFRPVPDFSETDVSGRVPEALRKVVLRTLEKSPENRVASAEELMELLSPFRESGAPPFEGLADLHDRTAELPIPDPIPQIATAESVGPRVSTVAREKPRHGKTGGVLRRSRAAWAALSLALLVLVVFGIARWWRPSSAGPHNVLIDAIPWARVDTVVDASGEVVPIDFDVTPALLSLPRGVYEVTLSHPSFPQPQSMTIEVPVESPPPPLEVGSVTPDAYFEKVGLTAILKQAGS